METKECISAVRRALFNGDFLHAQELVEQQRTRDPQLHAFGEEFVNKGFGICSFYCTTTDREWIRQQTAARWAVVLPWLNLDQQLFVLRMDGMDVLDPQLINLLKFDPHTAVEKDKHNVLDFVGALWANRQYALADTVFERSGLTPLSDVKAVYKYYRNKNSHGAFRVDLEAPCPFLVFAAFNYSSELAAHLEQHNVHLSDIVRYIGVVRSVRVEYNQDILEQYCNTVLLDLESFAQRQVLEQALDTSAPKVARKM